MPDPNELIDEMIQQTPDWRGAALAEFRRVIHDADPEIVEEWKWVRPRSSGTPVWEHDGIVCFGGILKERVRLTLWVGASLPDPQGLFNAMLEGNKSRAVDIYEGDEINESALRALVRSGVEYNLAKVKPPRPSKG